MGINWFGWLNGKRGGDAPTGLFARLRTDRRGNTLAIMAAALIPLAGMVGGGIDMSRMYIVKTRLQHACDAGALAGRKQMGSGTWSQASYAPRGTAERFFDSNFPGNAYGSTGTTKTYTENAGTVTGVASATVPMTLMRVLGKTTETLTVTCEAEMRLPNTDVMFVLDTTGSMNDTPSGDTMTKMASLKLAVKCFYEIVARLDTNATCTTGTPSGGTGNQVQVRFGFMPYATNVNVGKLLPTAYFANTWKYQTREWETTGGGSWSNWDLYDYYSSSSGANCNAAPANTTNTEYRRYNNEPKAVYYYGGWYCGYERRTRSGGSSQWVYDQHSVNVGLLKNGSSWNNSFQWPIGSNGANRTITWEGCIEERATVRTTDFDPIPNNAYDLNIDLVPSAGTATSLWGPALPELIYARQVTNWWDWSPANRNEAKTTANYVQPSDWGGYACPEQAKKLQAWPVADDFDDYVDSLSPSGNTYHDIGLLWGARFMSPTGIFASENALTPQGGEIDRHMIFMTDGDTCTGATNYAAYGVAWFDRRQTADNSVPTDGCGETGTLTQQVNLRTEALCTAIKNKNITLWVIVFGNLATATETRMSNCATSTRYFKATNAATLQQTFKSIADQISALRITK